MTLGLRWLRGFVGSLLPPGPDVSNISDAPIGAWAGITYPRATQADGTTYFGFVDGTTGDVGIGAYVNATASMSHIVLHHALSGLYGDPGDDHACPDILVRSEDQRLISCYCTQGDDHMRKVLSTNPLDITDWSSEQALSLGGSNYLYPCLAQLPAESSRIYLHWKDFPGTTILRQSHSDDGGDTWSSSIELYSSTNCFFAFGTDNDSRMDYVVTDTAPTPGSGNGMFHFYSIGGSFYQTDGTPISAGLPLGPSDLTQIYSDGGAAFPFDITYTDDGRPVVSCAEYGTTVQYFELRWSGSAWVRSNIATTPSVFVGDQATGLTHDIRDPNRVVYGKSVSSTVQMFEARSTDDGATWTETMLPTSYAAGDQPWQPVFVTNPADEVAVVWNIGSYTTDYIFDLGVDGST